MNEEGMNEEHMVQRLRQLAKQSLIVANGMAVHDNLNVPLPRILLVMVEALVKQNEALIRASVEQQENGK